METSNSRPSLLMMNDDVLLEICKAVKYMALEHQTTVLDDRNSFKLLSRANRYMRELMAPELFKSVRLSAGSWPQALGIVESMQKCQAVQNHTKRLLLQVHDPSAPAKVPRKLTELIRSMTKLETLTIEIPPEHARLFHEAFLRGGVNLPSVHTVVVGPCMEWIISMCPNVAAISTRDLWLNTNPKGKDKRSHSYDLITAASEAKYLQHFEMNERWHSPMLQAVVVAMPHISSLAMTGTLRGVPPGIKECLPLLASFTNLKTLATVPTPHLGVGFNPPFCGNAYQGEGGAELRRKVKEEESKATRMVAEMVFKACQHLETLWIGSNNRATVTRNEDGSIQDIAVDRGQRRLSLSY